MVRQILVFILFSFGLVNKFKEMDEKQMYVPAVK